MPITVKFFASLRETVGQAETAIEFNNDLDVKGVWQQVCDSVAMPSNTLCAINMEYVELNSCLKDGDEVAFFPPVTGG